MKDNSISCKHLSMQSCVRFFFALIVILFFTQCTEEKPTEQTEVKSKISLSKTGNAAKINFSATSDSTKKDSTKTKDKDKDNDKDIITPDALEYGWKREYQYVFDHYVAKREFGIMPTNYRQLAGSSGDPNRIQKLNELKSKWGFNYIAACIGDYGNIQAIVNAGFPISTNYMAAGFGTGGEVIEQQYKISIMDYPPRHIFGHIILMSLTRIQILHISPNHLLKVFVIL